MNTLRIAVPTDAPGGLGAKRSDHFGHCDLFTLVDVTDDGNISTIQTVNNIEHGAGGCVRPVKLLRENNVNTIVVSGMGARPLQRFAEAGIKVLFAPRNFAEDIQSLIDGVVKNAFAPMDEKDVCQGHGNCHH
ncbi:MAG: NifB/NifX family molybdenum-iron cluster-binding protein [Desulfobulbaceae bacterium]|nr:NifB/NifX family molybdenum-iron cluster-binding protein [Desulfobulbaceae bacterium]